MKIQKKIFTAFFAAFCFFAAVSCEDEDLTLDEPVETNDNCVIQGKVCYTNAGDNSNIIITLDKTDGLINSSVQSLNKNKERSLVALNYCDKDGNYKFSDLESGVYRVYAVSSDSSEKAVSSIVSVRKNETVSVPDLKLTATGSLSGKITIDDSENSNAGIIAFIGGTSFSAVTGMDGSFTISGIPAGGNYQLIVLYGTYTYMWKPDVSVTEFSNIYEGELNLSSDNFTVKNTGTYMVWKGSFESSSELKNPEYLWAYYNITDGCSYIFDGSAWTLLASAGADGADGNNGSNGTNGKDGHSAKALINYELNGGSLTADSPLLHVYGESTLLTEPVRDGYYFEGWYFESDFSGEAVTLLNEYYYVGQCVYAKWTKYRTLTYCSNTQDALTEVINYKVSELNNSVKENMFTVPSGYKHTEWNTKADGSGIPVLPGTELSEVFEQDTEKTLYAVWKPIVYSIEYKNLKDALNPNIVTSYTIESDDITLTAPSKDGYTFTGWNNGTEIIEKIKKGSTGDVTLTATWNVITYSITYLNTFDAQNNNPGSYTVDDEVNLCTLERFGYEFKGWTNADNIAVEKIEAGTTGAVTLRALWEAVTYTITYNCPQGTGNSGNPVTYTIEDNVTLYDGYYNGMYFSWFISGSKNACTGWKKGEKTGDIVLNAAVTVEYILNGGVNDERNSEQYLFDEDVTLYAPQKRNYTFEGWYTKEDFSDEPLTGWLSGEKIGNIKLYAKLTWASLEQIKSMTESGTVVVMGQIGPEELSVIRDALDGLYKKNSNIRVTLDFSQAEDFTEVPAKTFGYDNAGKNTLEGIILPNTVKTIGDEAFSYSGLTSIVIPDSVESMGERCFCGCKYLKTAVVGSGITELPDGAFNMNINLEEIILPDTLVLIGNRKGGYANSAFHGCENLKNIVIPSSVKFLGGGTFCNSGLTSIVIPDSVEEIGDNCFTGCHNLEEVIMGNGITELPDGGAMSGYGGCHGVFAGCSKLKNIKLSDNLEYIGCGTFEACYSLETIEIPASVRKIGCNKFWCATKLEYNISSGYYDKEFSAFYETTLKNVVFKNPEGWYAVRDWRTDAEEIALSKGDLSNSSIAAGLLSGTIDVPITLNSDGYWEPQNYTWTPGTYNEYTWIRKSE